MLGRQLTAIFLITLFWVGLSSTLFLYASPITGPTDEIVYIRVHDEISQSTENYIRDTVNVANYRQSRLIVISLDTPGGYVSNVENIMSIFDESNVPVLVFVEPLRAVSGGTYILMAAHVAVMKSGSVIGSCQPVSTTGEPITESKYINYLVSLITGHAWRHTRNETVAALFVTRNLDLNAEEASRLHVIDFVAEDLEDVLTKLSGYVLIKYTDGEAARFILTTSTEAQKYRVIQTWSFANINKVTIHNFSMSLSEFSSMPSYLAQFPFNLSFPLIYLYPYIYPVLLVPILSLFVGPIPIALLALLSAVNAALGIGCILFILRKRLKLKHVIK